MLARKLLFVAAMSAALLGCGPRGGATANDKKLDLDADPLALLPPGALAVASVDAHDVFERPGLGARLGELADRMDPLDEAAGFQPSRDLDRLVIAAYATGDAVSILRGHFDPARLQKATAAKDGVLISHGAYLSWTTSTCGQVSYAVLTPGTVVVGTGGGLRRALDRVAALKAQDKVYRALPTWMTDVVSKPPGVALAAAGDATDPLAAAAIATLKLPWLEAAQRGQVLIELADPGLRVSANLRYADPEHAESAASAARGATRWLTILRPLLGGAELQDLSIASEGDEARCSFAIDDRTLVALLSLAPKVLAR